MSNKAVSSILKEEEIEEFRGYDWPFENLVFEGGGAKCISAIGVYRVSTNSYHGYSKNKVFLYIKHESIFFETDSGLPYLVELLLFHFLKLSGGSIFENLRAVERVTLLRFLFGMHPY